MCAASLSVPAPAAAQGSTPTTKSATARALRPDAGLGPEGLQFADQRRPGGGEIGDAKAAAGFFARADEVNPRSPCLRPAWARSPSPMASRRRRCPISPGLSSSARPSAASAADRGLAYDLMGMQAQAQADYRAALSGADGDEARRRLALSLAISGDRAGALQTLAPLAASGDPATSRVRAFILALTGDANARHGRDRRRNARQLGSVAPFLKRLAVLQPAQKAAAVNLGIFPDSNGPASPPPLRPIRRPRARSAAAVRTGLPASTIFCALRLRLAAPAAAPPRAVAAQPAPQPVARIAYRSPPFAVRLPSRDRLRSPGGCGCNLPAAAIPPPSPTSFVGSSPETRTCSTASRLCRRGAAAIPAADRSVPQRRGRRDLRRRPRDAQHHRFQLDELSERHHRAAR